MARMEGFLISLLLVGVFAGSYGLFFSHGAVKYGLTGDDVDGVNSSLSTYEQLDDLNNQAEEIRVAATQINEKEGALDVIGSYFSSAYSTLLLLKASIDTFIVIASQAIDSLNIGPFGTIIKNGVFAIVIFLIVVGIFLKGILKVDI